MSNKPAPCKKVAPRRPAPALRACLSGIGKPHDFNSGSPAERICGRCKRQLNERLRGIGVNLLHPLSIGERD